MISARALLASLVLAAGLQGCASVPAGPGGAAAAASGASAPVAAQRPATPGDPFESFNRKVFSFNDAVDNAVLKPAAEGYRKVVPEVVRTGVDNVFGNIGDAWSTVNHFLQGKLTSGLKMTMRVLTNTTIGIAGVFDPATSMGLEREQEDFGQTLGRWGVPPGPYLVLPIFGPSDVRDALALPADRWFGPTYFAANHWQWWTITSLNAVSTRAGLLSASQILDDIALDRYVFLRDAYVARRRNQVYDGNPPELPDDDPVEPGPDMKAPVPAAPASAPTPAPAASGASAPTVAPEGVPVPAAAASAASAAG